VGPGWAPTSARYLLSRAHSNCTKRMPKVGCSLRSNCNSAKARVHSVCVPLVNKFTMFQLFPRLNKSLITAAAKLRKKRA